MKENFMDKKNSCIPKLRFPGFEGEWEEKQLGTLCINEDSKRRPVAKSQRELGHYPYYGANGVQDYVSDYLFSGDRLLVGEDGSVLSADDTPIVNWASGKFWVNNHAHVLAQREGISLKYVFHILSTIKIQGLVTGIPPKLNQENLNKIKIFLPPSLAEQEEIADCLDEENKMIDAQKQKVESLKAYKKGLTQQLFPQPGTTTPSLRFSGFTGEWQEKKFNEVFARITRKNGENNQNVLTISAQYGLISQLEFFKKSVASSDVTGYYLLHNGEFAYNKSSSQGRPVGAIKPLRLYDKGVVSTLYICFKCNDPEAVDFWEQYFDAGILDREILSIAQEGARNHGLLNIPTGDFFGLKVIHPTLPEMKKIAECLSALDDTISAEQNKLNALVAHKKGLMQQLFPQFEK